MGTINYKTSDYITLGLVPLSAYDLEQDADFMEWIRENVETYGGTIEIEIDNYISGCYDDDFENIRNELEKQDFYYFHVRIEPGYYEGFSLYIENNFGLYYDSWEDKAYAQKEVTRLKKFLLSCVDLGLVECFPGWCTGYSSREESIKSISETVQGMREEIKNTPTWTQYARMEA